jgi:hypothetical protein
VEADATRDPKCRVSFLAFATFQSLSTRRIAYVLIASPSGPGLSKMVTARTSIFRVTRRDCFLVVITVLSVVAFSHLTRLHTPSVWEPSGTIVLDENVPPGNPIRHTGHNWEHHGLPPAAEVSATEEHSLIKPSGEQEGPLPKTNILAHAPGWTIFRNLYMSNGTLYIVRSDPQNDEEGDFSTVDKWPLVRMMTSTGLPGYATEESIREREPTDRDMAFITPVEAASRWGEDVYSVSGTSVSTPVLRVVLPVQSALQSIVAVQRPIPISQSLLS